jgi:hypothetical protein
MNLQDRVEVFLNKAEIMLFHTAEGKAFMYLLYSKREFDNYAQAESHKDFIQYYKNRKIKLIVVSYDDRVDISLVDIKSLDTINLKEPKLVKGNYHKLFLDIPENKHIYLVLGGLSPDGKAMTMPPVLPIEPLKIRGYSVTDRRTKKE